MFNYVKDNGSSLSFHPLAGYRVKEMSIEINLQLTLKKNTMNHLERFKRENFKKAKRLDETKGQTHLEREKNRNFNRTGLPDPPTGRNHLEKFINRNRKAAGLEQK
jgi:hypothetical protein